MTNGRAGQHLWPARFVSATLARIATRGLHESRWLIAANFPQASDFSVEFEPPMLPATSATALSLTDRRSDPRAAQSAKNHGTHPASHVRGWYHRVHPGRGIAAMGPVGSDRRKNNGQTC